MESAILYFVTLRNIRINNSALTSPRGLFKILLVLPKGVVHEPEDKLSIFVTTKSDHKFGHGDCYTILYDNK